MQKIYKMGRVGLTRWCQKNAKGSRVLERVRLVSKGVGLVARQEYLGVN